MTVGVAPFDVLGGAIEIGDPLAQGRHFTNRLITQRLLAVGVRAFGLGHSAAPFHAPDDRRLCPQLFFDNAPGSRLNYVVVWFHQTRNQRFAQSIDSIDSRLRAPSRQRVGGEKHPRRIALHHRLHHHRQRDSRLVDAVARPVAHSSRRPQAAPTLPHCLQQPVVAQHIQKGVLLSGKGEVGQVLGGGGGTHSHFRIAKCSVGGADRLGQLHGHCALPKTGADAFRKRVQALRVTGVDGGHFACHPARQPRAGHKSVVTAGGHNKSAGHRKAGLGQLCQIQPFAASRGQCRAGRVQGQAVSAFHLSRCCRLHLIAPFLQKGTRIATDYPLSYLSA